MIDWSFYKMFHQESLTNQINNIYKIFYLTDKINWINKQQDITDQQDLIDQQD